MQSTGRFQEAIVSAISDNVFTYMITIFKESFSIVASNP